MQNLKLRIIEKKNISILQIEQNYVLQKVFTIINNNSQQKTHKIQIYTFSTPLYHFIQVQIKDILDHFKNVRIIRNNLQYHQIYSLQQRKIQVKQITKCNNKKIAILMQYQMEGQFCFQSFVLQQNTMMATLQILCKRKSKYSAICYYNMYIPIQKLIKSIQFIELGQKLGNIKYLIEDDGYLHIFNSQDHDFQIEHYLLQSNNILLKYQYLQQFYKWISINIESFNKYLLINKNIAPSILQKILQLISHQKVKITSDNSSISLNQQLAITKYLQPSLKYTVPIGYIYPYLYMIQKSNIFIKYNLYLHSIQIYKDLPLQSSLAAYTQNVPVLLNNLLYMYQIFKTKMTVHQFNLSGKYIRHSTIQWNKNHVFVPTYTLDFITVKQLPRLNKFVVWRVDDVQSRFEIQSEKDSLIFYEKMGFNMFSSGDYIGVYRPSNLELRIYSYGDRLIKYRIYCKTYINWISFSLCRSKLIYYNEFSQIYQIELTSQKIIKMYKKLPKSNYFYKNDQIMTVKNQTLLKLQSQNQPIYNIAQTLVISNHRLYTLSISTHINQILQQNS